MTTTNQHQQLLPSQQNMVPASSSSSLSSSAPSISSAPSSSTSQSRHNRTHSRNISIGGKNTAVLHDYAFSFHSNKKQQQVSDSTTDLIRQSNHLGPIIKTTRDLLQFYKECNHQFSYISTLNPRRVLTQPSEGVSNYGYDNANSDLIIYVNDIIIGPGLNQRYKVVDSLGQGTFGQVVKCQNLDTNVLVAVKILKNKPAYSQQGRIEVNTLRMLNTQYDQESHILRLLDDFRFKEHLCIVFELLSVNLFELIKQNNFRGLSTNLIKVFLIQILDALVVLAKASMIHCDLKPENILLQSVNSAQIKLIDFGSACFENNTLYCYIQSRHYRSPEVLTNVGYTSSIDMWSLGCISAELFLGLPLFPGTSEYNQICRIIDMRGQFPNELLDNGKNTLHYFNRKIENGKTVYTLKTEDEYSRETKQTLPVSKKYFNYKLLPDIIQNYSFKKNITQQEIEKEKQNRIIFTDFVNGLLQMDPNSRWTASQALDHPFITGAPYTGPYVPDPAKKRVVATAPRPIHHVQQQQQQQQHQQMSQQSMHIGSSGGGMKKMSIPIGSLTPQQYNNFPESYSPRGMFGGAGYGAGGNPQATLALGQSPSLFGGNPSYMHYNNYMYNNSSYYGSSWNGEGNNNNINSNNSNNNNSSKRGRSKSDAPTGGNHAMNMNIPQLMNSSTGGGDLLPPPLGGGGDHGVNGEGMIPGYDDTNKPPIYPHNSPQRKRSQSGHVGADGGGAYGVGGGGYPLPYIPRMHLDHLNPNPNRFRSHSYGEQHLQQLQQQQQQQQNIQHNMTKIQHSPNLLQHSAPQIFDHPSHHYNRYHQQQGHHHPQGQFGQSPPTSLHQQQHPNHSPPIPQSPHQQLSSFTSGGGGGGGLPLTPQLLSSQQQQQQQQDPTMSPALMSLTGDGFDRSPSEDMLFPLEVTPVLTSQQQKQQQQQQPPQNTRGGWKMDDISGGFSNMQIGDGSGSWKPSSSPFMIPPFSIQSSEGSYDDPSIIGFSPFVPPIDYRNQMMFQSPPTSYNSSIGSGGSGSFKQSPPTNNNNNNNMMNHHQSRELSMSSSNLTFNQTPPQPQQHYNSFTYGNNSNNNSGSHYNSNFSAPQPYSAPSKSQHQQQFQQSPPQSNNINNNNNSNSTNLNYSMMHQQQPNNNNNNNQNFNQNGKPIKGRPRNDAFSRTSPPTTRNHNNPHSQQSPSKPLSTSQTLPNQYHGQSTPLSPNTPPFIPQQIQQQLQQQQQQQFQQHQNSNLIGNFNNISHQGYNNNNIYPQLKDSREIYQQQQQQQINNQNNNQNQQNNQNNIVQQEDSNNQNQNRKFLIGTFRDASSPPP